MQLTITRANQLKPKPDENNLGFGIHFTDHVDHNDLPGLYNGASCFVFPSSYEGFGMPALEAISCGTPTIAYDNSSLPEVLGNAGLLVEEHDHKGLLQAIQAVLSRPQMAAGMREKGLQWAKKFRWEDTARKTLEAYHRVLSARQARRK